MTMIISGSTGLEFPDGSDQTTAAVATTPGGSTTQVQYNNAGAFGGNSGFVYSSGNVGIGTASPNIGGYNTALTVNNATSTALPGIELATAGVLGASIFYNGNTNVAYFGGQKASSQTVLTSAGSEQMRIDSSGRVGIGTTDTVTFGRKLIVNGTGGFNNDSGTVGVGFSRGSAATYGYIGTGDWAVNGLSTADFGISSGASGALVFGTGAGTERGRFTSAGLFQFNSGYGSVQTAYGCRIWVNFNGQGTIAIRGSGGVSSLTDNGTVNYTVNFSITLPDTNYATAVTNDHDSGSGSNQQMFVLTSSNTSYANKSTTALQVRGYNTTSADFDPYGVNVMVFR